MSLDDHNRYTDYFQRSLLSEGAESYWAGYREWFESNRAAIGARLSEIEGKSESRLSRSILNHIDDGPLDDAMAKTIFQPLLTRALKIGKDGYSFPKNSVRLASSPALDPSPAALPSEFEHVLFIGQGTLRFCNYWAKIFTRSLMALSSTANLDGLSDEQIVAELTKSGVVADAFKLASRHALHGTVLGFGRLDQPENQTAFRVMLLNAMEMFIVGHEVGHFITNEMHPETAGLAPGKTARDLELDCDSIGFSICSIYGRDEENEFAVQLLGPILLFLSLDLCDEVKSILSGIERESSPSHPSHFERYEFAIQFFLQLNPQKDLTSDLLRTLRIANQLCTCVLVIATQLARDAHGSDV